LETNELVNLSARIWPQIAFCLGFLRVRLQGKLTFIIDASAAMYDPKPTLGKEIAEVPNRRIASKNAVSQ